VLEIIYTLKARKDLISKLIYEYRLSPTLYEYAARGIAIDQLDQLDRWFFNS
jgi:hypothetical protein